MDQYEFWFSSILERQKLPYQQTTYKILAEEDINFLNIKLHIQWMLYQSISDEISVSSNLICFFK